MKEQKLFYGWVIVAAMFMVGVILHGTQFFFGVFFKSIGNEFNLTRATTSALLSTNMLLTGLFGFLGGWASDRYDPRIVILLMSLFTGISLLLTSQANSLWQLFITYSLLISMGTAPVFAVTMSIASRWFDKKRGLALGITGAGAGGGILAMAPFATYLISQFGWRTALIIIGMITWLIVIPLSRLLRRDPNEIGALPDGVKSDSVDMYMRTPQIEQNILQPTSLTLLQVCKTKNFWVFNSMWLSFSFNLLLVLTHLVPHATDIGFSAGKAATILSIMGGTSIAGRVLIGIASDKIGHRLTVTMCLLVQAGAMVWLIWTRELWMLYLFALLFGVTYGGVAPSMGALTGDIFELKRIGAILGTTTIGFAVGGAIGPTVGGLIFDANNSYSVAFLIGALTLLLSALFMFFVRRETGNERQH